MPISPKHTFTGRFHRTPNSPRYPKGRLLSIWKNGESGTYYRDSVDIAISLENARKAGNTEDIEFYHNILMKFQKERERLDSPRFF